MDPTRLLEADHRQAEKLFERIEKADGDDRLPLIDELATDLTAHMQLEEDVFYPAIIPIVGDDPVEEGEAEHALARKAMADVIAMAPDHPGFGAALEALRAGIAHHVDEEENELFPRLRREGSDRLADVATPFMKRRMELGLPMEAIALAAASTKEELRDEAQQAGVENASSMNKRELAEALASQMS